VPEERATVPSEMISSLVTALAPGSVTVTVIPGSLTVAGAMRRYAYSRGLFSVSSSMPNSHRKFSQ
jgi:hypothetical protein